MKKQYCNHCKKEVEIIPTGFRKFGENQNYKCVNCHQLIKRNLFAFFSIFTLSLFIFIFLISFSSAQITLTNNLSGNIVIPNHNAQINTTIDFNDSIYTLDTVQTNLSGTITNIKDPSLILCYNFDNIMNENYTGGNNGVYDWCGGNNGTVIGYPNVSYTTQGKFNGAMNFSGGFNYIVTNHTSQNFSNGFTLDFWYYSNQAKQQDFLSGAMLVQAETTNTLRISFGLSNGTNILDQSPPNVISQNKWNKLTITWNNSLLKIYNNGVNINNFTSNGILGIGTGSFIGALKADGSRSVNGTIDEFRLWNRTLSNSEIAMAYNSSLNKFNMTRYNFYGSPLNITGLYKLYGLYVNDTNGNFNNSLTVILRNQNISLRNNYIKSVPSDFFGFNGDNVFSASSNTITTDLTCTKNGISNYNAVRNAFSNSNSKVIRYEMRLDIAYNSSGSLTGTNEYANLTKWAYDNGYKILWIADYAPSSNRNTTANCTTTPLTCPPNSTLLFGTQIVNYLNNITNNGQYNSTIEGIEIWNEAYNPPSFMSNLSFDSGLRYSYYNQMYNDSYNAIKSNYSWIPISGSTTQGGNQAPIGFNNFLGNFSQQMDFLSLHVYPGATNINIVTGIKDQFDYSYTQCNSLSANCSRIILSEWNGNIGLDFSSKRDAIIGAGYANILNDNRFNITQTMFTFTNAYQNSSCSSTYQYIAYEQFTPAYYNPFNLTLLHIKYAPSGFNVYNSTSNFDQILPVSSKLGNVCNQIITNTENDYQNISISGFKDLGCGNLIMSVNDGTLYDISNNQTSYIFMSNYSVMPFTTPNLTLSEGIGLIKSNYLGENISIGNEIYISSDNTNQFNRTIHIASNLTTNVSIPILITNVDCAKLRNVKLTPNGSNQYNPSYSCEQSTKILTISQAVINPSISSNDLILDFDLGCSAFSTIGYKIIAIFMALIIPLSMLYYMNKIGWENITLGHIVIIGVSIIIGTVLYTQSSGLIGTCGVIPT